MILRWLCRLGLHFYRVEDDGKKFISQCRWCFNYERGYEP